MCQTGLANWQLSLAAFSITAAAAKATASKPNRMFFNGLPRAHRAPVWGIYPTSQWQPSEIVRDVYALPLPPYVQPEAVQIVIYHATAEGFENLDVQTINLK